MSIYGKTGFRIVRGSDYLDQNFDRMFAKIDFEVPDKVEKKSIITGYRNVIIKGKYNIAHIVIENVTKSELEFIRDLFNAGTTVTHYLHYDSIAGFNQSYIYGYIENFKYFYMNDIYMKDTISFDIKSQSYSSDNIEIIENQLVDESGNFIVDENDNNII